MKLSFDITPIRRRINNLLKEKISRIKSKKSAQLNVFICSSNQSNVAIDVDGDSVIGEAVVEQEGAILLPAKAFFQFLPSLEDGIVNIATMGGNLVISQGAFKLTIPRVLEAGTRDFEVMYATEKESARKNLIAQKESEIQLLRKKSFLGTAKLSKSDVYKERFIHDKIIYMRRLLQIKEREMAKLKEAENNSGNAASCRPKWSRIDHPIESSKKDILRDKVRGFILKNDCEILGKMSKREQKILSIRMGLKDGVRHTLRDTAKHFGLTRERIRQIETAAIRKILELVRQIETKGLLINGIVIKNALIEKLYIPISELELSVGANNILKAWSVKTIGDLIQKKYENFVMNRYVNKTIVIEIIRILKNMDLFLDMADDLKKEANHCFNKGNYAEAFTLYKALCEKDDNCWYRMARCYEHINNLKKVEYEPESTNS